MDELRLLAKWHRAASDYVAGFVAGYRTAENPDRLN